MGELSKLIGEKGEDVTKFIFEEMLNVNSLAENTSITCERGLKHKRNAAKGERTTHGIDGLYYFESPLEDELLDVVIISSKYTNEYPKNPKALFKEHVSDLAQAIECFKLSKNNSDISRLFSTVSKTEYTGILVWLSNTNSADYDITSMVSKSIIDSNLEFEKIILLDNARVNFLYETIYKTKKEYEKVEYIYHNSSMNQNSFNSNAYGNRFPVEYLYSDLIILRVEDKGETHFIIFVNDNFSAKNLRLLLSFAKKFDHLNTIDKTKINYIDYDVIKHEGQSKSALAHFPNFKLGNNLEINQFPLDYRR